MASVRSFLNTNQFACNYAIHVHTCAGARDRVASLAADHRTANNAKIIQSRPFGGGFRLPFDCVRTIAR